MKDYMLTFTLVDGGVINVSWENLNNNMKFEIRLILKKFNH